MTEASQDSPAARAEAALARVADCAVPLDPARHTGPSGPRLDELIGELDALAAELRDAPPEGERLVALLDARLGALLGIRFVLAGRDADRARARELLDGARSSALLDAADRAVARRALVCLLGSRMVRLQEEVRASGISSAPGLRLSDMAWAAEVGRPAAEGGSGYLEDTGLLARLLLEDPPAPMTPEHREVLRGLAAGVDAVLRGDLPAVLSFGQRFLDSGAGGSEPFLLPTLMGSVVPALESLFPGGTIPRGPLAPVGPDGGLDSLWELLALTEAMSPGTLAPEEIPRLIGALTGGTAARTDGALAGGATEAGDGAADAGAGSPPPLSGRMIAALTHFSQATRTGDMTGMNSALGLVHEAFVAGEFDAAQRSEWLLPVVVGILVGSAMTGGSLEDEEMADAVLRDLDRVLPAEGTRQERTLHLCAHVVRLQIALQKALDQRDADAVEGILLDLHDLDDAADGSEEWLSVMLSYALGSASLALATLTEELEDVRTAVHHFEQVLDGSVDTPALRTLVDASWAPLLALIALVEKDPARIEVGIARTRGALERPGITFDFEARVRTGLAIAQHSLYELTGDPEALDQAVGELERAREALPADAPNETSVHAMLAQRLAERAAARPGTPAAEADLRAAVAATRDALRAAADDVLLQTGVRHGLRMARQGADLGRAAALWALGVGDAEEAVGCLEAGRSLVLRAAAVSLGVADRLEALGAGELARHWRTAPAGRAVPLPRASGDGGAAPASPLDALLSDASGGGPALPGDVRRRSLALLRGAERDAEEPSAETVAALRAGLARCGVDALVHVLPGSGEMDGALLIVTPEGPVRRVPSPALSAAGRSPVARFLAAGAARQRLDAPDAEVSHQERYRVERAWTAALTELCAWAGEVLDPVLGELGLWERALTESRRTAPHSPTAGAPPEPRPTTGAPATGAATGAPVPGPEPAAAAPPTDPAPAPQPNPAPAPAGSPADVGLPPAGAPPEAAAVGSPPTPRPGPGPAPAGSTPAGVLPRRWPVPARPAGSPATGTPPGPPPHSPTTAAPPEPRPTTAAPATGAATGAPVPGPEPAAAAPPTDPAPAPQPNPAPAPAGSPAHTGTPPGLPPRPVPVPSPDPSPVPPAVRLVLVPCGELGVVPWQAAELRPPERYGGPPAVRLCEVAVVSHAASGREFLRAAARRRTPPARRPALVFHGYDLTWAEEEVEILREVHYPHALVLSEDEETPPTPEAVLALLDGRDGAAASLVHLACHGLAGPDPTASALRLAPPAREAAEGAVDAELTLSVLLDSPVGAAAGRTHGPLVVCSACETDLTTRDHDEALTVTSVLVHRLAADAIGSRWKVPDRGSEILMLVLHDRLAAGLAPPDALRAAQRWMLAPPGRRRPVAGLPDRLLRLDFRDQPEAWAAFVHQGNPAPAAPPGAPAPHPTAQEAAR